MSIQPARPPLTDVPFSVVLARVTYQLVRRDVLKYPLAYAVFAPAGIQSLAESLRDEGFLSLAAYTKAAARHVAGGFSMAEFRSMQVWNRHRSVYKQRWRR